MKFIADSMLGTLAKWLRIFGYDVLYEPTWKKENMINLSLREGRIILTRDTHLTKKIGLKVLLIKEDGVENQLKQVINELSLTIDESMIFTRCTICNVLLKIVPKQETKDKVPSYVYSTQNEFRLCQNCNRIYWSGTHLESVKRRGDGLFSTHSGR
ncbi:hypothetical protein COS91_08135 [Candidatus Desantisbacteria bacterium CG07_land_8_20_14_0_80_39_15]|uniref:Mut7-C RNAse domain-containing protein n=1 Tax=Candidatus Desantisbacteria bacterium CG07_land_8_20_14_0_80_39_15 TaxID=1974549 RepID=A0A2M6ZEA9_9BACT|nr:MAG: hypothetical protein COS91_08135 [Candidatus Desantisbacteria bacterium CG07_land_8_20_14_0_80_39_15]